MPADHERLREQVEDCIRRSAHMNEWERRYIDAITQQLDLGVPLTSHQAEALRLIWEKVTTRR
jgi:hypothetical protein